MTALGGFIASAPVAASYYSPGLGTVGNSRNIGSPLLAGEPRSMVIACADPNTVWGIVDGMPAWHSTQSGYVRSARLFEGLVFFIAGNFVKAVNPRTGFLWGEWDFGRLLTGLWVGNLSNGATMGVAYASPGQEPVALPDAIELFEISPGGLRSVHVVSEPTNNARSLYVEDGRIVVADTFGHRVFSSVIATGEIEASMPTWYPNDVRPMSPGKTLVTAEHENRLFSWEWSTGQREMVLSAPVHPFNDLSFSAEQIRALSPQTAVTGGDRRVYDPPKQSAAQEYHVGAISLYAPNAAYFDQEELVIADTDNDRVIVVRSGEIVTEVTGLNNPVDVAIFT